MIPWRTIAFAVVAAIVGLLVASHLAGWLRRRRSRVGQRFTTAGALFSLVTVTLAIVALHTKINFLVLLFGMLVSGLVLSFVMSRTTLRRLAFERSVPDGVHAGQPFTVELRVTNRKRLAASYGLVVFDDLPESIVSERPGGVVLELRPRRAASLAYTATAMQRGVVRLGTLSFSTRFPFGLFHQGRSRAVASELVVYPRLGVVAPGFLGRAQSLVQARRRERTARGNEEFRNLREYRPGDNPRRIHWKTSAKLGWPLVKEHEAIADERVGILLDTRCRASGEELLETGISFAATLARDLMLRGLFVSLAAYAPDLVVTPAAKGSAGFHALLEVLARLEPHPGRTLVELVREPRVRAGERALTVLVLRRTDEDAAAALAELQRRQPRVVTADASAPSFGEVFQLPQ